MHTEQQFSLDFKTAADLNPEEAGLYLDVNDSLEIEMESIWVSMLNGEQLHLRRLALKGRREPSDSRLEQAAGVSSSALDVPSRRRVFMLHGEVECGGIFYNLSGRGLAHYLARLGYEVFVADLGARGRSLVNGGGSSSLTVHQLVVEAIPRLLRAVEMHAPQACVSREKYFQPASIWVGHGFGGVLLSAAWARMAPEQRSAERMIFFGVRRKLTAHHRMARAFVRVFCHPLVARLVAWYKVFPATRLRFGSADENADWFRVYADWLSSDEWIDREDNFDYCTALAGSNFPATMHFAAAGDSLYGNPSDVRQFIEELGPHDARLLLLDDVSGSSQKYDHLKMLLHPSAEQDAFDELAHWLDALPAVIESGMEWGSDVAVDCFVDKYSISETDALRAPRDCPEDREVALEREEDLVLCA